MPSSESEPQPTALPPYSYVPGGRWPHPISSPLGHLHGKPTERPPAIDGDAWPESRAYLRGVELFNAGYYWEAHEAWEALWHAHGRQGATATVLKGLIKLAAAGVKIREGRAIGARTHAGRAAMHFTEAATAGGPNQLGLDLREWIKHAESIATRPPDDRGPADAAVHRVFSFLVRPRRSPTTDGEDEKF